MSWAQWHVPVALATWELKQEVFLNQEFETSLDDRVRMLKQNHKRAACVAL
jgi:hypothetical protein